MPQLAFSKEDSPGDITITVRWDQLADTYAVSLFCHSQISSLQKATVFAVPKGLPAEVIGRLVSEAVHNWIISTPATTVTFFDLHARLARRDHQEQGAGR